MFGWLRRSRRPVERDRVVFKYVDHAGKTCHVDPLVAWQAFEAAAGADWGVLFRTLSAKLPAIPNGDTSGVIAKDLKERQAGAAVALAEATTKALGVPPLAVDGSGMTQAERIRLAREFLLFMGGLAEKARPFANSPAPTAASPPG